jgi:hypothetical protein
MLLIEHRRDLDKSVLSRSGIYADMEHCNFWFKTAEYVMQGGRPLGKGPGRSVE